MTLSKLCSQKLTLNMILDIYFHNHSQFLRPYGGIFSHILSFSFMHLHLKIPFCFSTCTDEFSMKNFSVPNH